MSYKANGWKIRKVTDRHNNTYLYFQHHETEAVGIHKWVGN